MTDTKIACLGIWANPETTLTGSITNSITVKDMKSTMEKGVINRVNDYHGFETKLTRGDVSSTIYPDAEMGADILKLDKFITIVQPKATAQERFSTADVWNAIKTLRADLAEVRGDLAKETRGRLIDQENHENAVTKLEKRLKGTKSQQDDLKALRLEVRQLEQRLEDERREREVSEEKSQQKLKQQEGEIEKLKEELKVTNQHIEKLKRQLMPIHLRALLDYSRQDILEYFKNDKTETWNDLVDRSGAHLVNTIMTKLEEDKGIKKYRPSRKAVDYLCKSNDVRKDGNYFAHKAEGDEIKATIKRF